MQAGRAPAQASDLLSLSAQLMCPCYVGNIQNVICLMILEGRQVIFKTLSALQPFCGFCPPWGSAACLLTLDKSSRVLPGHLQQLVDGLCVGKQLACHLLPCSLPLRQHPEQLDGADAAVPSTRQKLLFEHCPSHWDFECLLLMALVQTNGKPT